MYIQNNIEATKRIPECDSQNGMKKSKYNYFF
jgi:hypothetical protein